MEGMEEQLKKIVDLANDNKPITGAVVGYLLGDGSKDKLQKALIGAGLGLLLEQLDERE